MMCATNGGATSRSLDNQGYTLGGRRQGSELFEEAHAVSAYIGITTIDVSDRSVRT